MLCCILLFRFAFEFFFFFLRFHVYFSYLSRADEAVITVQTRDQLLSILRQDGTVV